MYAGNCQLSTFTLFHAFATHVRYIPCHPYIDHSTGDLRMHGSSMLFYLFTDEDLPKIISATVDKERNELRVTWSTNSSDIVNIAVIADNVESGIKESVIVEYDQRETSITVNPRISYNVTVILHTKCQQKLTSEVYHTNEHVEELHPTPSKSMLL